MKMKKMWRRFWTLNRHQAEGFTLVELIVVIAILAILGGVAVPAYSGYVEKANKQADISLISDVRQALELAGYSGLFAEGDSGTVVLSTTGATGHGEKTATAMEKVFGESWAGNKLKYDGWNNNGVSFNESTYGQGGEERIDSLLGTVSGLSGALGKFLDSDDEAVLNSVGDGFHSYLGGLGISAATDPTAAGNAAVLYAAQNTQGKGDAIQKAISDAQNKTYEGVTFGSEDWAKAMTNEMMNNLTGELGMAGGMAAMYAYAEAFCQNSNNTELVNQFHTDSSFENVTVNNAGEAAARIESAFVNVLMNQNAQAHFVTYTAVGENGKSQAMKDIDGYVSAMEMVNDGSEYIVGNLGNEDCYTDGVAKSLLNQYTSNIGGTNDVAIAYLFVDGKLILSQTASLG